MKPLDEILKMSDPSEYLYNYAFDNDWLEPKWERLLLSLENSKWLIMYAINIIKGRWPEAEPIILKSPAWAFVYAREVIEDVWPEAEPIILKSPLHAYLYAIEIIEGKWPEAENTIKKDEYWWGKYCNHFEVES